MSVPRRRLGHVLTCFIVAEDDYEIFVERFGNLPEADRESTSLASLTLP